MPFDGFLFRSCVTVAKEAHTSPSVKGPVVAVVVGDDSQRVGTYVKDTGGITVGIHKVSNRSLRL